MWCCGRHEQQGTLKSSFGAGNEAEAGLQKINSS